MPESTTEVLTGALVVVAATLTIGDACADLRVEITEWNIEPAPVAVVPFGWQGSSAAAPLDVAEVIAAVNEDTDATRCGGKGDCQEGDTCLTHHLWMDLSDRIRDFLSDITLADLVARREIRVISEKQVRRSGQPNDGEQILVRTA